MDVGPCAVPERRSGDVSAATRVTKVVGAPAELSEPITAGLRNNGAVQAIDGVDATAVVWFAPEPDGRDFFDLELREWRGQTSDALFAGFDAVQSRLAAMRAAGSGRATCSSRGTSMPSGRR